MKDERIKKLDLILNDVNTLSKKISQHPVKEYM